MLRGSLDPLTPNSMRHGDTGCGSILAGGGGWASAPTERGGYWSAPSSIITGWYAGSAYRWSTDDKRRKVFDNKQDARAYATNCINIEGAPSLEVVPRIFQTAG